jgi:hypothetical protein
MLLGSNDTNNIFMALERVKKEIKGLVQGGQ